MIRELVLIGLSIIAVGVAQGQSRATERPNDPSPPPLAEHVYGPKDKGIKPPKVKSWRDPEYPKTALGDRRQGTVVLRLIVGSNGIPRDVEVVHPLNPELDKAAVDAVKGWKFSPSTKDGEPVASKINLEVSFRHN